MNPLSDLTWHGPTAARKIKEMSLNELRNRLRQINRGKEIEYHGHSVVAWKLGLNKELQFKAGKRADNILRNMRVFKNRRTVLQELSQRTKWFRVKK